MAQLLKNNVSGVLASQMTSTDTSMVLLDASNFPAPTQSDFYLVTLIGLNGNGQEASWEVVKVTAKASTTLTVVRGQESTTAATWPAATTVQLRLTAGTVATQTDLTTHSGNTSNPHGVTKAQVGLGNADNTADASKNVLSATKLTTARTINGVSFDGSADITVNVVDNTAREAAITAGTTAQYWRGDKSWQALNSSAVGLGNVDNTSDANKPVSTATQTALNGKVNATSGSASGLTLNDGYTEEVFAVTGTTPALSPNNGSIQTWTLTAISTPTAGTWAAGQSITLMVNDTASLFTVVWTSVPVVWVGGSAPTLAPAGGNTVITLWKVGTTIYGALVGQVA